MKIFYDEIQARSFLEEKGFTITANYEIILPEISYYLTDYEQDAVNFLNQEFNYEILDENLFFD